jgi:catalase
MANDTFTPIVDFEQPRVLWSKVWNDQQREAYVQNVSGHFKGVKSPEVKARQRTSFSPLVFDILNLADYDYF